MGWELAIFLGDTGFTMAAFWINAVYVALGEAIVLLLPGTLLYLTMKRRRLDVRLFL